MNPWQLPPPQTPAPTVPKDLPAPTEEVRAPTLPTNRLVEHGLAMRATRQGRFAEADAHFQRAWQLGPPTAELLNDMGYRLYLEGRLPEAESLFRQALALDPRHVSSILNLGRVLARQGRVAESLSVFRQVNGEAEAEANVAYVLADWGSVDAAMAHYGRATEISVAQRQAAQNPPPSMARLPVSPQIPAATARIRQVRPVE
jgi:Flp pilus assembly protein TadD